jgi:hypothetical protein
MERGRVATNRPRHVLLEHAETPAHESI